MNLHFFWHLSWKCPVLRMLPLSDVWCKALDLYHHVIGWLNNRINIQASVFITVHNQVEVEREISRGCTPWQLERMFIRERETWARAVIMNECLMLSGAGWTSVPAACESTSVLRAPGTLDFGSTHCLWVEVRFTTPCSRRNERSLLTAESSN